jgi:HPt (histidine-containing phosphotransfer) domain-containing protein
MGSDQHLNAGAVAELRKLMGDDFGTLVQTFVTDSDQRVVAIQAALDAGDPGELRRAAHSFKGSASNMGAPALAEFCRQAEECGREGDLARAQAAVAGLTAEYAQVRALMLDLS